MLLKLNEPGLRNTELPDAGSRLVCKFCYYSFLDASLTFTIGVCVVFHVILFILYIVVKKNSNLATKETTLRRSTRITPESKKRDGQKKCATGGESSIPQQVEAPEKIDVVLLPKRVENHEKGIEPGEVKEQEANGEVSRDTSLDGLKTLDNGACMSLKR